MILRLISFPAKAEALGVGLAALGLASGAGQAGSTADTAETPGPVRCEIQVHPAGGTTTLKGVVHADVAVSGTYSFHVSGSGRGSSTNIQQGGGFTAGPNGAVTLGQVMLGSPARPTMPASRSCSTARPSNAASGWAERSDRSAALSPKPRASGRPGPFFVSSRRRDRLPDSASRDPKPSPINGS